MFNILAIPWIHSTGLISRNNGNVLCLKLFSFFFLEILKALLTYVKKLVLNTQGIIQKKSASGSRTLPFVIYDKKLPFLPKVVTLRHLCYLKAFLHKTLQKVPFFEDSGRCPEILNYTLIRDVQCNKK